MSPRRTSWPSWQQLKDAGTINQAEYDQLKAKTIAG